MQKIILELTETIFKNLACFQSNKSEAYKRTKIFT